MEKRKASHPKTPCNQPAIAILTHTHTQHLNEMGMPQIRAARHEAVWSDCRSHFCCDVVQSFVARLVVG